MIRPHTQQQAVRIAAVSAAGLLLCGCATTGETDLLNTYSETQNSLYSPSETGAKDTVFSAQSVFGDYLLYSFANSPRLRASLDRWKAALERIPQARSLNDPELSFDYMLHQYDKKYQVALMQKLPLFGELGLQNRAATARAEAAMHAFENARFMLYDQTSDLFYGYAYLGRETAITEENLKLLTGLEQIAETRFKDGTMPYSELIQIQIEKERLVNRHQSLQDRRRAESAELTAVIHYETNEPLPWPELTPSSDSLFSEDVLQSLLEELNPELKETEAQITAREIEEQLARRRQLPGFKAGVGTETMANDNQEIMLKAGLSIPLWLNKNRAAIREAEAETRAAKQNRQNLHSRLKAELSVAVFQAKDAQRRMELYRNTLIPKAEQSLAVAKQDFSTGATDIQMLIQAQQILLEFQLAEQRAVADREIALTEIGCCIGQFQLHAPETITPDEGSDL